MIRYIILIWYDRKDRCDDYQLTRPDNNSTIKNKTTFRRTGTRGWPYIFDIYKNSNSSLKTFEKHNIMIVTTTIISSGRKSLNPSHWWYDSYGDIIFFINLIRLLSSRAIRAKIKSCFFLSSAYTTNSIEVIVAITFLYWVVLSLEAMRKTTRSPKY